MIIDVSCDRNGGIETSVPTTIAEPTYVAEGILHYAVDHTPSLFYKSFTYENSKIVCPYLDQLITGDIGTVLKGCMIIENGVIVDEEIIHYQKRQKWTKMFLEMIDTIQKCLEYSISPVVPQQQDKQKRHDRLIEAEIRLFQYCAAKRVYSGVARPPVRNKLNTPTVHEGPE